MAFYKDGYIIARTKAGTFSEANVKRLGVSKYRVRDEHLVKYIQRDKTHTRCAFHIGSNGVIGMPIEFAGKKVRLKVEVVGEEEAGVGKMALSDEQRKVFHQIKSGAEEYELMTLISALEKELVRRKNLQLKKATSETKRLMKDLEVES